MIAALYVERGGVYSAQPGIAPWDEERDARLYRGPYPVVAHPPCERWGRYWGGGPSVRQPRLLGDDGGCFAHALWSVRTFGGVLEHPEASHAWRWFGLVAPLINGGWTHAEPYALEWPRPRGRQAWTCCVFQGHYGHEAPKATWLYYVGRRQPPELIWGRARGRRLDEGFHSAAERRAARARGQKPRKRLSAKECAATPVAFREVLIDIAKRAGR